MKSYHKVQEYKQKLKIFLMLRYLKDCCLLLKSDVFLISLLIINIFRSCNLNIF